MAQIKTLYLPAEYVLRLTADEFTSGTYYRVENGKPVENPIPIQSNTTISTGSFSTPREYAVASDTGNIEIIKIPAGAFGSTGEGIVVEDVPIKAAWFDTVSSGTSGSISTLPEAATLLLDSLPGGLSALVSGITNDAPDFELVTTSGGTPVTATLDANGDYTLSGTPSSYPVAIIFGYKVDLGDLDYSQTLEEVTVFSGTTPSDFTLNDLSGDITLDGTANQITVSDNMTDTITLSTPQDIATTSNVTFNTIDADGALSANAGATVTGDLEQTNGSDKIQFTQAGTTNYIRAETDRDWETSHC